MGIFAVCRLYCRFPKPGITNLVPVASSAPEYEPVNLLFTTVAGVTYQITVQALSHTSPFSFSLFLDTPQPAQLAAPETLANGQLRLLLTTLAEQDWVLQTSTNLVDWGPSATDSSHNHVIEFLDPIGAGLPARFYRVQSAGR